MGGPVKPSAGFGLGFFMGALRTRVVLRNRALVLTQNIDAEPLFGMQVGVCARGVVHANQD